MRIASCFHRLTCGAVLLTATCAGAAPSTQFTLTGAIDRPATYGIAGLQALPSQTQTVDYLAGSSPQTRTYVGTSLWSLVSGAGVQTNPAVRSDVLNRIVVATGSDGYRAVYSAGELNPSFGDRPDLVAYAELVNGAMQPIGDDGFARVTAPGDVRGGRYVSNLVNVDVRATGSTAAASGDGVSTSFTVSGAVT